MAASAASKSNASSCCFADDGIMPAKAAAADGMMTTGIVPSDEIPTAESNETSPEMQAEKVPLKKADVWTTVVET